MRVARPLKSRESQKNFNASGLVISSQVGIHPHLEKHLARHVASPWLAPLHQPTVDKFNSLRRSGFFAADRPIILDSGCGTGKSTRYLAENFPEHLVIGADRSQARLAKSGLSASSLLLDNCLLIRAELSTFWRLLIQAGVSLDQHYLLYPNPSPKSRHLNRRWHGHPVFPQLLCLGGQIEMRCNWEVYAWEFARAASYVTGEEVGVSRIHPEEAISPFEQKYLDRGQDLYSVVVSERITAQFRQQQKPA